MAAAINLSMSSGGSISKDKMNKSCAVVSTVLTPPEDILNKLKCNKCENVLSVLPVYSLPSGKNICGRCVDIDTEGTFNQLYETVLQFLAFPCMNQQFGCMEIICGQKMFAHESKCAYRRINCPIFKKTSCDWIGEIDSLLEHFESNHTQNLLTEPTFEINFIHNYEEISLLPYAESLFLVKQHGSVEDKRFWCSIQTIFTNEHEEFEYFITLTNSSKGISTEFSRKKAISLNDSDGIEVKFDEIQCQLQYPSTVIASISIIEVVNDLPAKPNEVQNYLSESNLEMLKIIECPVCFEYMVPPIYQCAGGHSICGDCKNKVQQCPTCEKSFGETQNYAVESFTSFLKYPCKNFEKGCEYLSPAKEIRKHEKMCKYGEYQCPTYSYTSCKWTGMKDNIWRHCKDYHCDNIVEAPLISIPFIQEDEDSEDEDYFILKFLKNIFILHWEYNENKMFNWTVQLVGPPEYCKNYYFDLDIIDRSGRNLRIFMRCPCESFTDKESAFAKDKSFLFLTFDQVKSLINEVFCFKISIYKNCDEN
ncbi:hypothetical protein WA026_014407 [Henosepilachna vigintioctopunctata]|uniref:E3 ubiquitin-protein ligase n=1 Tax=Henosepilachna vigintioctopunctata TaxID=420089 RepID=A0AAW1UKJ3_9CUCU